MLIIPAIDIIDEKLVRLTEGNFEQTVSYGNTPLGQAKIFADNSFEWLHIIDLKGSLNNEITVLSILEQIKNETNLKIEFGGGIRSVKIARELMKIGIDRLIIGSISILDRKIFEKINNEVGSENIIIAADVINESVFIKGWSETSGINLFDHIEYCKTLGIKKFLCTDIMKDGKLENPNFELYKKLRDKNPEIDVIASGGVTSMNDLEKLKRMNLYGAVVGKAIYENRISIEELKNFG